MKRKKFALLIVNILFLISLNQNIFAETLSLKQGYYECFREEVGTYRDFPEDIKELKKLEGLGFKTSHKFSRIDEVIEVREELKKVLNGEEIATYTITVYSKLEYSLEDFDDYYQGIYKYIEKEELTNYSAPTRNKKTTKAVWSIKNNVLEVNEYEVQVTSNGKGWRLINRAVIKSYKNGFEMQELFFGKSVSDSRKSYRLCTFRPNFKPER